MDLSKLSPRQKEIFELNSQCLSRFEICQKLSISGSTLRTHLIDIASKLTMPERMNIQYFMACIKINTLQKRQAELEKLLAEFQEKKTG